MATTNLIRMMKKSASSVIPLANRVPRRNYTSNGISTTSNSTTNLCRQVSRATLIPTQHHNSAQADTKSNPEDKFLRVIEYLIGSAEEKFHEVVEAPKEFPFHIVDNAGEKTVTLTREYQGEEIVVTVKRQHPSCYYVELDVSVSKKNGLTFKFDVTAELSYGITINSWAVKNSKASDDYIAYEEPEFSDLDENLQDALFTYLKVRGFEPNNCTFLCNYMVQRNRTKDYTWLKNMRNFVAISTRNSTTNLYRQVSRAISISPTHHHKSAQANKKFNSDENLLSVIESVIDSAEQRFPEVLKTPSEFPFKIVDNAGEETITLIREYQDEEIKVRVHGPQHLGYYVDLDVSVPKKSEPALAFIVKAVVSGAVTIKYFAFKNPNASDEINVSYHYHGPAFSDLDQRLQKALYTYLEVKGIETSIGDFLSDYMVQRKHKRYTGWLKNLKNLLAN